MNLRETNQGVFTRRRALAVGLTPKELDHRRATGELVALRRGIYVEREVLDEARRSPRDAHLLAGSAALLGTRLPAVLSHHSAATAWGLPLLGALPSEVALTFERQHRRRAPGLEVHTARTPPTHRAVVDGLPVTSVARTVSDLARSRAFRDGVVAADAALHSGACTMADLRRVVADLPTWRGIARTKRVLEFADRRSESPGESLSRAAIAHAGLPAPELQVELLLGGQHVRVDFMWVERAVVGEFDGRVKYGEAADLWKEKLREDLLRRHGYRVVRWTWSDVYPRDTALVDRLASVLG
jgi:very-short-patch-repair endonuclease